MASTADEARNWTMDESAEITSLPGPVTRSQKDDMEDNHWMLSLRAAFSAWKEPLWVPVGACHWWTRSSWLRTTTPVPPSSIPSRTEPSVKIWKSAGGMEARI